MPTLTKWHYLEKEGTKYLIKKSCDLGVVKVIASDLVHLWVNELKDEEVLSTFHELNPLIECNDSDTVHKMIDNFLDGKECSKSSLEVDLIDDHSLRLKFGMEMDGLKFKFILNLSKGNPEIFFKEVTLPLLLMSEELFARQDFLCSLLEKKDVEIAQYKLEGACLSRRNVETQPFSKVGFLSKSHANESVHDPFMKIRNIINILNLPGRSDDGLSKEFSDAIPPACSYQPPDSMSTIASQSAKVCDEQKDSKLDINPNAGGNFKTEATKPSKTQSNTEKAFKRKKPKLNL